MATLLSTLKLVTATRATQTTPEIQRRRKLIAKIDEQIGLATALLNDTTYQPTKFKNVVKLKQAKSSISKYLKK